MRFSEAWLRQWVDPDVDTPALADQLSMAGLEVDAVEPSAPAFSGVVVGLVHSVEPHPDADKLRVCKVDVGAGEPVQVICGAANVAEGMRVPLATVGARLPGDLRIRRAKMRGVESFGMVCSAAELGLAESSEGIMPLPPDAPVGRDLRDYLALDDSCIELDLTPDRSDCLSLAGVAREVGVINRAPVRGPEVVPVPPLVDDRFPVVLEAPEACPRYACRVVRGVDPGADTPLWLRERLRRSGLRPITPVVDVTNYVMMELGQPMHGFDLERLDGGIRVRTAEDGEHLALLNGEEIELRGDTLVIADRAGPVALAGIMGGAHTAVGPGTTDILLESAFFAPAAVSGRARSYGLHTDSSHRFERGVDPQLQCRAIERATALLLGIAGGRAGSVVDIAAEQHLPSPPHLRLRRDRIRRVLGLRLEDGLVEDILTRLGMEVSPVNAGWEVTAPTSRFDLLLEVDLIAEIGRIFGYKNIPASHAAATAATTAPPEAAFDLDRARLALVERGYQEVITYSFVNPALQERIEPDRPPLRLANPLSADMSVMRTSLWAGLLQAARGNLARQQERVRIFESGLRFQQSDDGLRQDRTLAGLLVGDVIPEQWGEPPRAADFFDAKADVEAVLCLAGGSTGSGFVPARHPALHPGQTARIERDGRQVGLLGMLHPALAADMDIAGNAFLFELALDVLADGVLPAFTPISKFPAIRRDLAIVVDRGLPYQKVRDCVSAAAPDLLRELLLFDVYQGEKIDSGLKSLALGLILQASSQTLTDKDVERIVGRILERLEVELGARLRD
jgi:phenylalanyl-tRNA synthetase beta chain